MQAEVTGSHAGWQLALGERHGQILGEAWTAAVTSMQARGPEEMKVALDQAIMAKSSTVTRNGTTPEMAVFGRSLRLPGGLLADDDDSNLTALQALGADGEMARAYKARHEARMAILRLDVQDIAARGDTWAKQ